MSATSQTSMQQPQDSSWITGRLTVGEPRVRLICLAQAGAGAGAFSGWRHHVPDGVELAPVELPGRRMRQSEPMPETFEALMDELFEGLVPELTMPYVLFGHSFGGSLAYEVARRAEADGLRAPLATVISGTRAPQIPAPRRMADLEDRELIDWLVDNDGLPEELLKHTTYLRHVVRAIRGDLRFAEDYLVAEPAALGCPLHVFAGADDQVFPAEGLSHWDRCAAGEFSMTVLPGSHDFPYTGAEEMVAAILDVVPASVRR